MARYWSINTAATAVLLSAHSSPLAITTKLAAAILGGGCSEEVFCRPSITAPVGSAVPNHRRRTQGFCCGVHITVFCILASNADDFVVVSNIHYPNRQGNETSVVWLVA